MRNLELSPEAIRELGEQVTAFVTRYLSTLSATRITPEGLDAQALRRLLDEPVPYQSQGVERALSDFEERIAANAVRIGHPRFFAWVRTSPLAGAVFAETLAAALNQSVAVWQGAPSATEVERLVIRWLREISGFAPTADGLLTSGGSMANFIALLTARQAAFPQVRQEGLRHAPDLTVYLTDQTHYSVIKAVEMMGLGRRALHFVPTDEAFRMNPDALREAIRADRHAGRQPMAVVATLGTTNTGACDDLVALAQVCAEAGVWLHVDGAYGGIVASVPGYAHLARGLPLADSLTIDPHKTLFVPFEAGAVLLRDLRWLPATFRISADYLPGLGEDPHFHFRDYGPQLSRMFRALKIYLTLKIYGFDAIRQAMAETFRLAQRFAEMVKKAPDFELLAPVTLGIVTFRYRGTGEQRLSREALNPLNAALAREVQKRGQVFLASTRLREQTVLRAAFLSYRTSEADIPLVLEEIRTVATALGKSMPGT